MTIHTDLLQIEFSSGFFTFVLLLTCRQCGREKTEICKGTILTNLFVGCSQCETYPSFCTPLYDFFMMTARDVWKYSARNITHLEEKLKTYTKQS